MIAYIRCRFENVTTSLTSLLSLDPRYLSVKTKVEAAERDQTALNRDTITYHSCRHTRGYHVNVLSRLNVAGSGGVRECSVTSETAASEATSEPRLEERFNPTGNPVGTTLTCSLVNRHAA
ncbi:hypothetical protein HN011_011375 [Eciton burchellii]|jgi:hypothetical protein|nr:hypothetical protein HN011_011375 [Eciton burchellii]